MPQYEARVNAPEFPAGLDWLNVRAPLKLKDLRGKIVLLDFWTYCCINCMHIIPDLKKLEAKYPDELVVIGVHSAKFHNERETENILQAVLRCEIEHPVVNDREMSLWHQYTVRAWPTVVLIDPEGKVVGAHAGEGMFRAVDPVIAQMKAGVHDREKVPIWIGRSFQFVPQLVGKGDVKIVIEPRFPDGMKLNERAPSRLLIRSDSSEVAFDGNRSAVLINALERFPVELIGRVSGSATLKLLAKLYYCHAGDEGLCFYTEVLASITLMCSPDASATAIRLEVAVV